VASSCTNDFATPSRPHGGATTKSSQFIGIPTEGVQTLSLAMAIDPRLIGFGSLFMLLTLAGFVFYALAGAAVGRLAEGAPSAAAWSQRAFGALLLGFAARLAVAER